MAWCTLDAAEVPSSDLRVSSEWGEVHNSSVWGWHTIAGTLLEEYGDDFTPRPLAHGDRPGLPAIRLDDRDI